MKNCCTQGNVVPLAADEESIQSSNNPNHAGTNLAVLVVVDYSFHCHVLVLHHKHIATTENSEHEEGKHGHVEDWFGDKSKKVDVNYGRNENCKRHDDQWSSGFSKFSDVLREVFIITHSLVKLKTYIFSARCGRQAMVCNGRGVHRRPWA